MKKCYLILLLYVFGTPLFGLDGLYLGGHLGHVGLTGSAKNYSNAIGFGAALGMRTSPMLDVMIRFDYSHHSGGVGLTLLHPTLTADFHFYEMNDFDLAFGAGPGFYFFKSGGTTESNFGLNVGMSADVIVDENLRLGLGWRWHHVLDGVIGDHFWSIMMRVGYLIEM